MYIIYQMDRVAMPNAIQNGGLHAEYGELFSGKTVWLRKATRLGYLHFKRLVC